MTSINKMQHLTPKQHQYIATALAEGKSETLIISKLISEFSLTIPKAKEFINLVLGLNSQANAVLVPEKNFISSRKVTNNSIPFIKQLQEGYNKVIVDHREMSFVFNMSSPEVVLIENFLDPVECQHLIDLGTQSIAKSTVAVYGEGTSTLSNFRTSSGAGINRGQDAIVKAIEDRITLLFNWNLNDTDDIQVLRYELNEEYKPHYDFFADGSTFVKKLGERVATLIMYLAEPEKGGTTSFPDLNLKVHCKQGSVLFFTYPNPVPESKTLHAGEPVIEGTKWIATKWFRSLDKQG